MPTCTLLHSLLDVIEIKYIHDIPKSVCNRTQVKKIHIVTSFFLADSGYDYILKEIDLPRKIEFERDVDVLCDNEEILYEHFK